MQSSFGYGLPISNDFVQDPLSKLAIKHGCDKWGPHEYAPLYHKHFSHLREEAFNLLEIGVGGYDYLTAGGMSLRMWAEYFPHAQIFGLDLYTKILDLPENVHLLQGDQSNLDALTAVCNEFGPFTIVIDDGSHRPTDMLTSFYACYGLLTEEGIYCIEDVQGAFNEDFGGNKKGAGITKLIASLVGAMHALEGGTGTRGMGEITQAIHIYRNLLIVDRGVNNFPSTFEFQIEHPAVQEKLRLLLAQKTPGSTVLAAMMALHASKPDLALTLVEEMTGESDLDGTLQWLKHIAVARLNK